MTKPYMKKNIFMLINKLEISVLMTTQIECFHSESLQTVVI